MTRLAYFLTLPVFLSFLATAQAGPACARRSQGSDECVSLCKDKWGWPGHVMGTDPWGSVMTTTVTTTNSLGAAVTQACKVRSSGALSSATTSVASNTSIPTASADVPKNVQISASVSTLTSAAVSAASSASLVDSTNATSTSLSIALLSRTASDASSTHISLKATAFASRVSSSATRPRTSSTTSKGKPTSTSTTPKPTTTSTTPKPTSTSTSTKQPSPTTTSTTPKATTTTTSSSTSSGSSSGGTSQSDINAYLQAHNTVRAQHGASPLTWSDSLASTAQGWANKCVFQHSGGTLGPFGENLAAGTGSSYGIGPAIKSWTDEVSEYDSSNPQASHFTQVVWKATTQVGCAVASCNGIFAASFGPAQFFVCEYSVQGNVIGEFAQNVQA